MLWHILNREGVTGMKLKETMKRVAALLLALLLLTGISRSLGAAAGERQASPPQHPVPAPGSGHGAGCL